jgi:hypothetical protein
VKTTVVHINQHVLKAIRKTGKNERAVTVKPKSGGRVTRAFEASGLDEHGREMFRVVCRPFNPLSCGAVCWVETKLKVVPLTECEMSENKTNGAATKPAKAAPVAKPAKAAKPKSAVYEAVLRLKGPDDLAVSRIQKALQKVFDEGLESIETTEIGDNAAAKLLEDLDRLTVGKVSVRKAEAKDSSGAPAKN